MLIRSTRETKQQSPWRSRERVVRDGRLVYAVGSPIPREEAIRQGIIENDTTDEGQPDPDIRDQGLDSEEVVIVEAESVPAVENELSAHLRPAVVQYLAEQGIETLAALLEMPDEAILDVPGIGPGTLRRLRQGG